MDFEGYSEQVTQIYTSVNPGTLCVLGKHFLTGLSVYKTCFLNIMHGRGIARFIDQAIYKNRYISDILEIQLSDSINYEEDIRKIQEGV